MTTDNKRLHSRDFPQQHVPQSVDDRVFAHIMGSRTQKKRGLTCKRQYFRYVSASFVVGCVLLLGIFATTPPENNNSNTTIIAQESGNNNTINKPQVKAIASTNQASSQNTAIDTESITTTLDEIDTFVAFLDDDASREFDELQ